MRFLRWWFTPRAAPLLLFFLALALRSYGLGAPLLDYHSWRQTDTAAIARNFVASGLRFGYPQVDWGGRTPGYVESEFPLYSGTLALLFDAFGAQIWLGRLLTALAGALAAPALFWLMRMVAGRRAACYGGLMLALSPFAIYFGRAVMPDTWMLLFGILALLTFWRWLAQPTPGRYALALLCGTFAPLAKTPNLIIIGLPLAYLTAEAWQRAHRRSALLLPLLVYAACFTLPSLAWMQHARTLPLDPTLSFGIGEKLLDLRLLADPQFYLLLARWSIENVLTWVGLPFFVTGLVKGRRKKAEGRKDKKEDFIVCRQPSVVKLPYLWLLGVLLFLLVGAAGVVGQDYYILPLVGPAAWFIGVGIDHAQRWVERRMNYQQRYRAGALFVVLFALFFALGSFTRIAPLYHTADFYRTLGQRVNLALPAGERVGVIAPAVSEILYYGARTGWRLDPGVLVPGGLASLGPDLGVRYVLITDPWLSARRDVLTAALRDYERVPVGPYALLLDLQQPGLAQPFELVWETGHLVQEPFLSAWQQAGGAAAFGLPISDALARPEGREQFFERGLLVERDGQAKRAPVGRLLLEALGRAPQAAAVAPAFQEAWQQAGGANALGAPLSPPIELGGVAVQVFEFGTLEQPPGGSVVVGGSGRRLLEARDLSEERQIVLATEDRS